MNLIGIIETACTKNARVSTAELMNAKCIKTIKVLAILNPHFLLFPMFLFDAGEKKAITINETTFNVQFNGSSSSIFIEINGINTRINDENK
nr:hypothetical protein [Paenibacillus piri]